MAEAFEGRSRTLADENERLTRIALALSAADGASALDLLATPPQSDLTGLARQTNQHRERVARAEAELLLGHFEAARTIALAAMDDFKDPKIAVARAGTRGRAALVAAEASLQLGDGRPACELGSSATRLLESAGVYADLKVMANLIAGSCAGVDRGAVGGAFKVARNANLRNRMRLIAVKIGAPLPAS
jgi:hypothetical protein